MNNSLYSYACGKTWELQSALDEAKAAYLGWGTFCTNKRIVVQRAEIIFHIAIEMVIIFKNYFHSNKNHISTLLIIFKNYFQPYTNNYIYFVIEDCVVFDEWVYLTILIIVKKKPKG